MYEVEVVIQPSSIEVHHIRNGEVINIPLAELIAYRYESFNDRMVLRLKQNNGNNVKLVANGIFGKVGDFGGMIQILEQAVSRFESQNTAAIKREKTFFERPISTVLLVVAGGIICFAIVDSLYQGHPLRGNMFSGLGALATYFAGWLAASKRRNQ